jgi:hypothetical protein
VIDDGCDDVQWELGLGHEKIKISPPSNRKFYGLRFHNEIEHIKK